MVEVAGAKVYALSDDGAVLCTLGGTVGAVCVPAATPEGLPTSLGVWDGGAGGTDLLVFPHEDGSLQLCVPEADQCVAVPFLTGMRGHHQMSTVARGDVDGDGPIDLVVGRPLSPDAPVVPPHICWGAALPASINCEALDIPDDHHQRAELVDLDGDAHLDLLLGTYDIDAWAEVPHTCLGDGTGHFDCEETAFPDDTVEDAIAFDVRAPDLDGQGNRILTWQG